MNTQTLFTQFWTLNILDLITTKINLKNPAIYEVNPFMHIESMVWFKLVTVAFASLCLCYAERKGKEKSVRYTLIGLNILLLGVVLWNVHLM